MKNSFRIKLEPYFSTGGLEVPYASIKVVSSVYGHICKASLKTNHIRSTLQVMQLGDIIYVLQYC